MSDAIALSIEPTDIDKGRQRLANIKGMERARLKQREISGSGHQLLWLAIAAVGGHKAWSVGYWPISIIIAAIWTFTSVQLFRSIRGEYNSRFGEIIFEDDRAENIDRPTVSIKEFKNFIDSQTEQASSPWNLLEFGEQHYPPAALRKRQ